MTVYFLARGYPMKLLEEAASLAESKDRGLLIDQAMIDSDKYEKDKQNILLITRYNPNFHDLRHIVHNNWEMLGKSQTTDFLFEKKIMCAYKRPKNIRDLVVRANVPFLPGDEKSIPGWEAQVPTAPTEIEHVIDEVQDHHVQPLGDGKLKPKLKQRSILDFLLPFDHIIPTVAETRVAESSSEDTSTQGHPPENTGKNTLTEKKNRGFSFCNKFNCRYCKLINKSGEIKSTVTKKTFMAMKKISCRSSNLIYCIQCKRCNKQYVGQTSLRVKGRFVYHFYTVEKPDKSKPVGKHFSLPDHKGIDDMDIFVLEFISKPPKSEAAARIRDRVEKRWIHLLRTTAPGGLNIDD
jgi:hypothetical protein